MQNVSIFSNRGSLSDHEDAIKDCAVYVSLNPL